MEYKLVKNVDKFNNVTTIKMKDNYYLRRELWKNGPGSLCIRHVSTPTKDSIFIDFFYDNGGLLFLDGGQLIIRLDDLKNIPFNFISEGEREKSYFKDKDGVEHYLSHEHNYVEIDKSTLEKICNATSVSIKAQGKKSVEYTEEECVDFVEYCNIFYEGLYDNDSFAHIQDESVVKEEEKKSMTKIGIWLLIFFIIFFLVMWIDMRIQ